MYMIGIVAHTSRAQAAHQLMADTHAAYMNIDNGTLGCTGNHRKVWQWLADHNPNPWSVILEDDAIPCDGFKEQLTQALTHAPTPLVSLYLGTGHPRAQQPHIFHTLNTTTAHYLTTPSTFHAVALALHTGLITDMLTHTQHARTAIDKTISTWASLHNPPIHTTYTLPSLIDHTDGPTTTTHARRNSQPRKAWQHGTRTTWDGSTTCLNPAPPQQEATAADTKHYANK